MNTQPMKFFEAILCCLVISSVGNAQTSQLQETQSKPIEFSEILSTFINAPNHDWSLGAQLPIRWETAEPIKTPEGLEKTLGEFHRKGRITLSVNGAITHYEKKKQINIPGTWDVILSGTQSNVTKIHIGLPDLISDVPDIMAIIKGLHVELIPYRCDKGLELAHQSNDVYEVRLHGSRKKIWLNEEYYSKPAGRKAGWCYWNIDLLFSQQEADMVDCLEEPTPIPDTDPSLSSFIGLFPDLSLQRYILDEAKRHKWTHPDQVKELMIYKDIWNLEGIQYLSNLEHLMIQEIKEYRKQLSLPPLQELKKLTRLSITNCYFTDSSFIKNFIYLKELQLDFSEISDISSLEALSELEILSLKGNRISDISALSNLHKLKSLDVSMNKIADISVFASLINLEYADVSSNRISDISSLSSLVTLRGLNISANIIADISPLATLINLTGLRIGSDEITDISPLFTLRNLEGLTMYVNRISDFSILKNLTKLKVLYLTGGRIKDASWLTSLVELQHLSLPRNEIEDISMLKNLKKLEMLNLEENLIKDVSALGTLANLTSLYLSHNAISDIWPLANVSKLSHLELEENPIHDIAPLLKLSELRNSPIGAGQRFPCKDVERLWEIIDLWEGLGDEMPDCIK